MTMIVQCVLSGGGRRLGCNWKRPTPVSFLPLICLRRPTIRVVLSSSIGNLNNKMFANYFIQFLLFVRNSKYLNLLKETKRNLQRESSDKSSSFSPSTGFWRCSSVSSGFSKPKLTSTLQFFVATCGKKMSPSESSRERKAAAPKDAPFL